MLIFMPETFIKQTQDDIRYCDTLIMHNYYNYVQFSACIYTCQPPDKTFLDIGSNFPVCFFKNVPDFNLNYN